MARRERLIFHPDFATLFNGTGWQQFSDFCGRFLSPQKRSPGAHVTRSTLPTPQGGALEVYFKLYENHRDDWRFWLRASKARCEFENYLHFAQLGVPTAEAIAWGEERDLFGRVRRACIVTRAIPDCLTLIDFFQQRPSREERAVALRHLAGIIQRLHIARFYGRSLVWRNILVSRRRNEGVKLFLIDCPRGGAALLGRSRRRLRDLATLDKCAVQYCSRTERLKFLLTYLQKSRLDDEARAILRGTLEYRRKRWPDEWRGR
jgi:hypothetical protein